MKPTHQYNKAPITEAVIDIQTQHTIALRQDLFDSIAKGETEAYPKKNALFQGSVQFQLGPEGQTHSTQKFFGIGLFNHDQKQAVQLRLNGFTFSRLNPYEGWHKLMPEAKRLWRLYRETTKPDKVTRLAVRFINRVDLPTSINDLSSFLTMLPTTAPGLGNDMQGFFMQLQLRQPELKAMLVLTEALTEGPPDKLSILLDIDLFRDTDVPQEEEEIWQLLEHFHVRKNEIFEASITDETRKIIDE